MVMNKMLHAVTYLIINLKLVRGDEIKKNNNRRFNLFSKNLMNFFFNYRYQRKNSPN